MVSKIDLLKQEIIVSYAYNLRYSNFRTFPWICKVSNTSLQCTMFAVCHIQVWTTGSNHICARKFNKPLTNRLCYAGTNTTCQKSSYPCSQSPVTRLSHSTIKAPINALILITDLELFPLKLNDMNANMLTGNSSRFFFSKLCKHKQSTLKFL